MNTLKCHQFSEDAIACNFGTGHAYDVSVKHASLAIAMSPMSCSQTAQQLFVRSKHPLLSPMSGVAQLPFGLSPSLRYKAANDAFFKRVSTNAALADKAVAAGYGLVEHESDLTLNSLLSGTEETGRDSLVKNLKARIVIGNGQIPPNKKRGLGAEVLAHVQALIESPGDNQRAGKSTKCSEAVCLESHGMLSLALAVVEAMQRSSSKQFHSLCKWQCSYDTRAVREEEMKQRVLAKNCEFHECLSILHSQLLNRIQRAHQVPSDETIGEKEKEKTVDSAVVDIMHTIMQLVR